MNIEQWDRAKLYWIMQSFGWGMFFIIYTTVAGFFIGIHWQTYMAYANTVAFGYLFTHLYRKIINKQQWQYFGLGKLTVHVLLASVIIALLISVIVVPINQTYFILEGDSESNLSLTVTIITIAIQMTFVVLGWSLIYFIFHIFVNFKKSEIEKWQLEASVKDAELIALKSQINPHFIFNSLNNIRALVIEDPSKARDMITHLSDLLRYSVQFNAKAKVSIEDELDIVENYLHLESIQYEDRLAYKLDIEQSTLEHKIPPMAIQLLVENAIKHGISDLPSGGVVHISTRLGDDQLEVEVKNTGKIQSKTQGTGIGLSNVADRLQLLFGKESSFRLENIENQMVSAKFVVPLSIS